MLKIHRNKSQYFILSFILVMNFQIQNYCFYCISDQINAAFLSMRDFQKHLKKILNGSVVSWLKKCLKQLNWTATGFNWMCCIRTAVITIQSRATEAEAPFFEDTGMSPVPWGFLGTRHFPKRPDCHSSRLPPLGRDAINQPPHNPQAHTHTFPHCTTARQTRPCQGSRTGYRCTHYEPSPCPATLMSKVSLYFVPFLFPCSPAKPNHSHDMYIV